MSDKYIFSQFDVELNFIFIYVLEMGGLVELQLYQVVYVLVNLSMELVDQVLVNEVKINQMEMQIDYEIIFIIGWW